MDCAGMTGADGNPLRACAECGERRAPVADDIIANEISSRRELEDTRGEYSAKRFKDEMKKCILCFSCRQACYGCYCQTCFADRVLPNWQPAEPGFGAKMTYHLGRAMHLAGRCVECGACENACASGVDVRYIIRGVTEFIEKEYGFRAGIDIEASPVMQSCSMDDRNVGFWGGDERE
jgi:ferredoxin